MIKILFSVISEEFYGCICDDGLEAYVILFIIILINKKLDLILMSSIIITCFIMIVEVCVFI